MKYIIAIDGGGTKTIGQLSHYDNPHQVIDELRVGSSSLSADFDASMLQLTTLIERLFELAVAHSAVPPINASSASLQFVISLGIAGAGSKKLATQCQKVLQHKLTVSHHAINDIIVMEDCVSALMGCSASKAQQFDHYQEEHGLLVTLGTGSFIAKLSHQAVHFVGGWGFPIGDEGSGAKLGQMAVQAFLTEYDSQQQSQLSLSDLSSALQPIIGTTKTDILAWLNTATPRDFAALVPIVVERRDTCLQASIVWQRHIDSVVNMISMATSEQQSDFFGVITGGLGKITLQYLPAPLSKQFIYLATPSLKGALSAALDCQLDVLAPKWHPYIVSGIKSIDKQPNDNANSITVIKNESNNDIQQLAHLMSESRNPRSLGLDSMSSREIVDLMNKEDAYLTVAVDAVKPTIAAAVDVIVSRLKKGGRIIYMGAGTSGRLGVLDAVECPPTFSTQPEQIVGLIAGGLDAMFKAVEGAEDNATLGKDDLMNLSLTPLDVVIGIAASGRTPYVIGGLKYANSIEAATISVSCNPNAHLNQIAQIGIAVAVGPEVLSGSTRLKAGTAQKMILNMLSTGSLVQLGKCYENLMVDVSVSNIKLKKRAIGIIEQAVGCNTDDAERYLIASDNHVKLAILMAKSNLTKAQAIAQLTTHNGYLRSALEQ